MPPTSRSGPWILGRAASTRCRPHMLPTQLLRLPGSARAPSLRAAGPLHGGHGCVGPPFVGEAPGNPGAPRRGLHLEEDHRPGQLLHRPGLQGGEGWGDGARVQEF